MGYHVADEDDGDVFLRERKSVLARSEEIEDRVEIRERNPHEYQTDDDVQADHIAEDLICRLIVLLAQKY